MKVHFATQALNCRVQCSPAATFNNVHKFAIGVTPPNGNLPSTSIRATCLQSSRSASRLFNHGGGPHRHPTPAWKQNEKVRTDSASLSPLCRWKGRCAQRSPPTPCCCCAAAETASSKIKSLRRSTNTYFLLSKMHTGLFAKRQPAMATETCRDEVCNFWHLRFHKFWGHTCLAVF